MERNGIWNQTCNGNGPGSTTSTCVSFPTYTNSPFQYSYGNPAHTSLWANFGILLTIFSVGALSYVANFLSAFLLFFTIAFYLFVYTIWLKRKTPQNIVIGGIAGSLPPVIGWSISTNSISIVPISLFLIIFFWTPSHFWALSLYKVDDYKKAKIPMMPLTDGIEKTKFYILIFESKIYMCF